MERNQREENSGGGRDWDGEGKLQHQRIRETFQVEEWVQKSLGASGLCYDPRTSVFVICTDVYT